MMTEDEKLALQERIIEALKTVYDPEIPVNIYDLGLIYRIELMDDGRAEVDMTLTAPNCPAADFIMEDVRMRIEGITGITAATITGITAIVEAAIAEAVTAVITATDRTDDAHLTDASIRFHTHMGYQLAGKHTDCGYKFGKWYSVVMMEKSIRRKDLHPEPFVPFSGSL